MEESNSQMQRLNIASVLSKFDSPQKHTAEPFGLFGSGKNVKILVVDSGVPDHHAIKNIKSHNNEARAVNFTASPTVRDMIGHSTIVTGIVGASDAKGLTGVAPDAEFFFAKAIDDHSLVKIDSIIASILWGVIKEVDIIVLPVATDDDSPTIHETVRKAFDAGICVVAPTGKDSKSSYPAIYNQCLAIGSTSKVGPRFSATGDLDICGDEIASCYLEQTYIVGSGVTCSIGIATGVCAVMIESRRKQKNNRPIDIYESMMALNKPIDS